MKWLDEWLEGKELQDVEYWNEIFSQPFFLQFKPKHSIRLYRAESPDKNYNRYTSWAITKNKAEKFIYKESKNKPRKIISRIFNPDEMVIFLGDVKKGEEEIIVKPF